ncbi:hypothetical protein NEUTE2DRAFT_159003 [Neurospora tetrasperma FGSC 2509]|nr:hypothetical protein NEUTE2DRAFT_159003 [Neurospora tetrasperma FGSC 2509]
MATLGRLTAKCSGDMLAVCDVRLGVLVDCGGPGALATPLGRSGTRAPGLLCGKNCKSLLIPDFLVVIQEARANKKLRMLVWRWAARKSRRLLADRVLRWRGTDRYLSTDSIAACGGERAEGKGGRWGEGTWTHWTIEQGYQPMLVRLDFSEGKAITFNRGLLFGACRGCTRAGQLYRVNWRTKEADLRPTHQKGRQRTDSENSLYTGAHGGIAWRRAQVESNSNTLLFLRTERRLLWAPGSFEGRPTRCLLAIIDPLT